MPLKHESVYKYYGQKNAKLKSIDACDALLFECFHFLILFFKMNQGGFKWEWFLWECRNNSLQSGCDVYILPTSTFSIAF